MQPWPIGLIVVGSAIAATLSEVMLFRMYAPPDAMAAFLVGSWVAMPYLAAVGMMLIVRRHPAALVTLLVTLLLAGGVGVSLLDASATRQEIARQEAESAVEPGEDPDHGPAAMRKAGADMGVFLGGAFGTLLVAVLSPVQFVAIVVATGVAFAISASARGRARSPRQGGQYGNA